MRQLRQVYRAVSVVVTFSLLQGLLPLSVYAPLPASAAAVVVATTATVVPTSTPAIAPIVGTPVPTASPSGPGVPQTPLVVPTMPAVPPGASLEHRPGMPTLPVVPLGGAVAIPDTTEDVKVRSAFGEETKLGSGIRSSVFKTRPQAYQDPLTKRWEPFDSTLRPRQTRLQAFPTRDAQASSQRDSAQPVRYLPEAPQYRWPAVTPRSS